jgi:hypothetical protein
MSNSREKEHLKRYHNLTKKAPRLEALPPVKQGINLETITSLFNKKKPILDKLVKQQKKRDQEFLDRARHSHGHRKTQKLPLVKQFSTSPNTGLPRLLTMKQRSSSTSPNKQKVSIKSNVSAPLSMSLSQSSASSSTRRSRPTSSGRSRSISASSSSKKTGSQSPKHQTELTKSSPQKILQLKAPRRLPPLLNKPRTPRFSPSK